MRLILGFVVLSALPLVAAQSQADPKLGKSDAQILAMGRQKWFEFATKLDDSTAGMASAERTYGQVLQRRNDNRMRPRPEAERTRFQQFRRWMTDFDSALVGVREAFSGGGTMWIPVYAGVVANVEEALYPVAIRQRPGRAPGATWATVNKNLAALQTEIERRKESLTEFPMGDRTWYDIGLESYAKAVEATDKAQRFARELGPQERPILMFFVNQSSRALKEAREMP